MVNRAALAVLRLHVSCFILLLYAPALHAQVAGYRVGTAHLDRRALPCERVGPVAGLDSDDVACRPSGDVYLRFHRDTLVEIDTNWVWSQRDLTTAPDVWRHLQGGLVHRFGSPDSVRTYNPRKLEKAFLDGLAAFWTKPAWCAVLSIKTPVHLQSDATYLDFTVDKHGREHACSVYPYLEPSR